jgi:hypothetical protein
MNIIPFDSGKVPAAITTMFGDGAGELIGNNAGGGFPVVSIKGKVFHIQRGDERTLVTKPGEDDPAASIEVVILRANPNRSKVYYSGGYVEGDKDKPTCYSNSGIAPELDAQEPQAKKCVACPHNQWGAKITEDGRKAKACADSRKLAIATLDAPNDPMMIRVPAASMRAMEDYGKQLAARNVPSQAVVTKIGFDYSVAHPALTFKPVGLIGDATMLQEIKASRDSDLVMQIVGLGVVETGTGESEANADLPVIAATKPVVAATKPVAAPATTKPVVAATKPKPTTVKEEALAQLNAAKTKPAANVEVTASATEGLESQIGDLLDELDFDA